MPVCTQEITRESTCLTSKYETIFNAKRPIDIRDVRLFREVNEACARQCGIQSIKICMTLENNLWPIVQTCSFEGAIVHSKSSRSNNVQRHASGRTQPRYVACIRRYLWLN